MHAHQSTHTHTQTHTHTHKHTHNLLTPKEAPARQAGGQTTWPEHLKDSRRRGGGSLGSDTLQAWQAPLGGARSPFTGYHCQVPPLNSVYDSAGHMRLF